MFRLSKAIALLTLMACSHVSFVSAANDDLSIRYTANAGVVIGSGPSSVLIDTFFSRTFGRFHALEREEHKSIYANQIPLALATHIHGDHFSSGPVIGYLNTNGNTMFASSEQVIKQLKGKVKERQLISAALGKAETMQFEHRGMKVTMLNMPHGVGELAVIHNYAQLVDMNGWKVLHVGDAAIDLMNTAKLNLGDKDIDVAIVPYWYLFTEGGDEQMAMIGADNWIFVHMPTDDIERFNEVLRKKRSSATTLSLENKLVKFSR